MGKYIVLVVALLLAVWIFPYNKLVGGIFGVLGVGVFCLIWHCDNRTEDFKPVDCLKRLLKRFCKKKGERR